MRAFPTANVPEGCTNDPVRVISLSRWKFWNHQLTALGKFSVPLSLALILTFLACSLDLDHQITRLFYQPGNGVWWFKASAIQRIVYDFAPVPALVVFGVSCIVALGSIVKPGWRRWTRISMCWILLMLLGPGLLVNGLLKEYYGRPRPVQTLDFGGTMEYRPVWRPGSEREAKSFPSGHASVGFYLLGGWFFWRKRNRNRAMRWLALGIVFGLFVGTVRIAVGAHWFSDIVWSGTTIWYSGQFVAAVCKPENAFPPPENPS